MRIAFVITRSDAVGGASIHVRDFSRYLIEAGHEVRVFIGGTGVVTDAFTMAGVPFTSIPSLVRKVDPSKDLRAILELRTAFAEFHPDLVSTHTSKAGALGRVAAWSKGIPAIYTPHCWSFTDGFPGASLYLWAERLARPFGRRIIMVSEAERTDGLRYRVGSKKHLVTVHNGMPDIAPSLRSSPQSENPKLVMVGRFEPQKDQLGLIRALASLKDLPWTLDCIGDGPTRDECENEARLLGIRERINFLGYRKDVAQLLSKAQVFCLITNWEGFPRSIIEAMRAGLPVVASDVGGNREAVRHDSTGFIVPRGDVSAASKRLRLLLENPSLRKRMGDAGRGAYEDWFTIDAMIRNTLKVWSEVLGRRIALDFKADTPVAKVIERPAYLEPVMVS